MSRPDYRLADGAEIVFVPGVDTLWHLPVTGDDTDQRSTLCGLDGPVYAYGAIARRRRCCTVCAARAPKGALTRIVARGRRRRGKPKGTHRKITDAQIRALHLLHWEQRVSINQIAKTYYERLGYSSHRSFCSQLCTYFKELGLPTHDRIEMTVAASTKHGMARRTQPKNGGKFGNGSKQLGYKRWLLNQRAGGETRNPFCAATKQRTGKPCTHRAMNGSVYCYLHDPAHREKVVEQAAAIRARSPLQNPLRVEDSAQLEQILRDYHAAGGTWRELEQRTDIPAHWLSHVAHGTQKNVDRRRAQRIRDTILPVELAAPPAEVAA